MKQLVKRRGHTEPFDEKKLYGSILAACMSLRMKDEEAELLSETVSQEVVKAVADAETVDAATLHKHVAERLHRYNPDAAFLYDTHRDLS